MGKAINKVNYYKLIAKTVLFVQAVDFTINETRFETQLYTDMCLEKLAPWQLALDAKLVLTADHLK